MERTIKKRDFYGVTMQEVSEYEQPHRELSRKAASEGIVLLKNDRQLLPLKGNSSIALFGTGVSHMVKGGTGSGDVNEREVVSICQGLKNAGYNITSQGWIDEYDSIYTAARISWRDGIMDRVRAVSATGLDFFNIYSTTPFFMPDGPEITVTDAKTAIYVISRVAGEGADRINEAGDYYLTAKEKKDIADLCRLYESVVLVINTGGVIDLSYLDAYPKVCSILYLVQPGMEGGNALADVIGGKVTPSGKLTDTWAFRYEDYPNALTFSHMNGDVNKERYTEGIYVGYRYFDTFGVPVRYGFGYGLSYTDFRMETVGVTAGPDITVDVKVTNIGTEYSGKEIVQVYVSAPSGKLEKEYRRLCGFAKTSTLVPGESETLTVHFPVYQMASYDEAAAEWILDKGEYSLWVGNSLNSSTLEAVLSLDEKKGPCKGKKYLPSPGKSGGAGLSDRETAATSHDGYCSRPGKGCSGACAGFVWCGNNSHRL